MGSILGVLVPNMKCGMAFGEFQNKEIAIWKMRGFEIERRATDRRHGLRYSLVDLGTVKWSIATIFSF